MYGCGVTLSRAWILYGMFLVGYHWEARPKVEARLDVWKSAEMSLHLWSWRSSVHMGILEIIWTHLCFHIMYLWGRFVASHLSFNRKLLICLPPTLTSSIDAQWKYGTVQRACQTCSALRLIADVLELWNLIAVEDQHSRICISNDGCDDSLTVVGFTDVFRNSYFLTFAIEQHLDAGQMLDRFKYVFIRFVSLRKNLIQVFTLFRVSMSSILSILW